jgi:hypothetical protein
MDSRSGLRGYPIAPVETNVSKSCLVKIFSVICMVVIQACSRVCYHIDVTGDWRHNVGKQYDWWLNGSEASGAEDTTDMNAGYILHPIQADCH